MECERKNRIEEILLKRKYYLYQKNLTKERMKLLSEELKANGYRVSILKKAKGYSLYCKK
ncbi:MAG: hypothetical protein ACLRYM_06160 [Thomasclavelia ramosa]